MRPPITGPEPYPGRQSWKTLHHRQPGKTREPTHGARAGATNDIVLENYKAVTLERYGLDQASLRKRDPQLIYCSVTGFGQTGSRRDQPAGAVCPGHYRARATERKTSPSAGRLFRCSGYSANTECARLTSPASGLTAVEDWRVSREFYNWINTQYGDEKTRLQDPFGRFRRPD